MYSRFLFLVSLLLTQSHPAHAQPCEDALKNAISPTSHFKSHVTEVLSVGPSLIPGTTKEIRKVFGTVRKEKLSGADQMQIRAHIVNIVGRKYWTNPEEEIQLLTWLNSQIKISRLAKKNPDRIWALEKIIEICNDRLEDYVEQLRDFDHFEDDTDTYKNIRAEMRAFVAIKYQSEDLL
jgi:hypothetical protein